MSSRNVVQRNFVGLRNPREVLEERSREGLGGERDAGRNLATRKEEIEFFMSVAREKSSWYFPRRERATAIQDLFAPGLAARKAGRGELGGANAPANGIVWVPVAGLAAAVLIKIIAGVFIRILIWGCTSIWRAVFH
jgi:hypothetical protein